MASSKTVVLVTGANTGLGFEAVKVLYKSSKPYDIIIGARDLQKGQAALESIQKELPESSSTLSTVQVDLNSDSSIQAATETLTTRHGKLDSLVNNAGGGFDGRVQDGSMTVREAWNAS